MAAIFKTSLQNISPLPTSLKVEPFVNTSPGFDFTKELSPDLDLNLRLLS